MSDLGWWIYVSMRVRVGVGLSNILSDMIMKTSLYQELIDGYE
jgi:hypothetical protein